MKKYIIIIISLFLGFLNVSVFATNEKIPYTKVEIKLLMKKVADWQIKHQREVRHHPLDWTNATLYIGMAKWAELADKVDKDEKYYKWLVNVGNRYLWKANKRMYHADDLAVCQMFIDVYNRYKDKSMLKPTIERIDWIIDHPSKGSLIIDYANQTTLERWSWCDALFMAPPIFTRLYKETGNEKYLQFMDKEYIWHPFTQMKGWNENKQLVIDHGEGVKLYDVEGNAYYDGISSLWVNIHGHRRWEIDEAVKKQLDKIAHTTLLGLINKPSAELAKKLVEVTPKGLNKVFYSDDGSTAVEAAVKIAFQYWQHKGLPEKQQFINLGDSYHGDTVGAVSVGNIDVFHKVYKPLLFNTKKMTCPSFYHSSIEGINNEIEFRDFLLQELEDYLKENSDKVAAMIIEPLVQAAAGMLMQPKGYIKGVRELTKKYNVLLIIDEVATGFGRTGKLFACENEGICPDMMCLSKGITAGYMALGATMVTDEIYNTFLGEAAEYKTFYHGHSYTGNPLACAAGVAGLELFEKDDVIENLPPKMAVIAEHIQKMNTMKYVGNARQCGMLAGIELMHDKNLKIPFDSTLLMAGGICQTARKYGLIVRNIGDVIIFMPPLVSTVQQIEEMLSILEQAMQEVFEKVDLHSNIKFSDPCAF